MGSAVATVQAVETAEEAATVVTEAKEVDLAVVTEAEEGTAADRVEEVPGQSGHV